MSSKIDELKLDIEELSMLIKTAKRPKITSFLSLELRKFETALLKLTEEEKRKEGKDVGAMGDCNKAPTTNRTQPCYDVKLSTYAWDQSDKFVKIFVTLKNVHTLDKDKVVCVFDPSSMELMVKELENRNYFFRIKGFLHEINDAESYIKVKNDLVTVFLAKKKQGQKWSYLSLTEQQLKEPKKTPSIEPDEDPSSSMMNIMKKMYEEGDDEMKRTIAKVWTESRDKKDVVA
ncbi:calcyclin-binding protein [Cimex lectularius]|uniref:Calcyclin-binding protein n=1 Tax=Cimex lectularius TaxID=79782 RepID=A0A8I6S9L2_CIMLE|nr:calcyclin-binding protein [Cimex lectularius]